VDPDPGQSDNPITLINKYVYSGNAPSIYSDPTGMFFGLDDLLYVLYIGVISAVQAEYQVHNGGDSDYHKNFWNNFAVNLLASAIGLAGSGDFKLGYGGGYSDLANSTGRAYSVGFFQNTAGSGFLSSTYWHEVGHSINFFISGFFWKGDLNKRLESAASFYGIHIVGSVVLTKYNPITTITEGGADLWTAPKYDFKHLKEYQAWW